VVGESDSSKVFPLDMRISGHSSRSMACVGLELDFGCGGELRGAGAEGGVARLVRTPAIWRLVTSEVTSEVSVLISSLNCISSILAGEGTSK